MKILALEDQQPAGMILAGVLQSLGHEVDLVSTGEAAWTQLRAGHHRVVVSDWQMPGVDGLELCRMIRKRGGDYVYFILVSVRRITKKTRQIALDAGVDDFLVKPVDPDDLGMRLHVAERILGLTAQVRELASFLPICSYCKKIRDDQQYWREVEAYFKEHQGTEFSHGICPDCYQQKLVPEFNALGIVPPEYYKGPNLAKPTPTQTPKPF
jgi:phosphoserine phosphatase RsbU/P